MGIEPPCVVACCNKLLTSCFFFSCSFAWPHHVLKFHAIANLPLFKNEFMLIKWEYTKPTFFLGCKISYCCDFFGERWIFHATLFCFENNHPKGGNLGWFCEMSILGKDFFWGQVLITYHIFSNLSWDACYWHSNRKLNLFFTPNHMLFRKKGVFELNNAC